MPWIGEYITGIYNYGVNIAGILAAIMLMAGGLLWLVSGGDAGRITQAKELIIGSVTGLIILAGSYIILIQIDPNLVKFAPLNIGTINYPDENWPVTKTAAQSAPTYCGCVAWKTLYDTSNLKTAQAIDAKLSGTPLAGQGTLTAQLCQTTKIDPALVLAIWSQDSSYATAGAGKTNMNPGNVTCGTQTSGAGWTCNGRFRQYTDFNAAITDWFNVVGKGRRLQSANTIRDLIKTYAPPTDSNNTQGYINSVMTTLDAAHGDLKASDGSPAALQKCSDINTGC